MVEKGLKWLAVFVFPKHYSDVQEENENYKEFIINSTSSSSRIPEIRWALLMLLRNFRNTFKFESCYSRVAAPEMQSNWDIIKSVTPEILTKSEIFMSDTAKTLSDFVLSSVKFPKTSAFNSWRKMHECLLHKI